MNSIKKKLNASTGNRTRTARVAGEHSTIEPSMLGLSVKNKNIIQEKNKQKQMKYSSWINY